MTWKLYFGDFIKQQGECFGIMLTKMVRLNYAYMDSKYFQHRQKNGQDKKIEQKGNTWLPVIAGFGCLDYDGLNSVNTY